MKFPTARQKCRIKLAETIHTLGPMSQADLVCATRKSIGSGFEANRAAQKMIDNGMLIEDCGKLRLSYDMHAWLEDRKEITEKRVKPEVVQPRTAPAFKPLNTDMYANVRARLDRDITFKNGLQTPVPFHRMEDAA